jgi:hypothetical protein
MTQTRAHHSVEPSAGLELIEPAEGPEDLLAHLLTLAHAMDNLEILVGTGAFDTEKHRGFLTLHPATTDVLPKQHKTVTC